MRWLHSVLETMARPSWETTWLSVCAILAKRSTCWKRKTAALLVDENNRPISLGYNGTPAGDLHCEDRSDRDPIEHRAWSKEHEIHAEANALLYLTRFSRPFTPATSTLYTLLSPCLACAMMIHAVGIGRVVIQQVHRQEGIQYLTLRGVQVDFTTLSDEEEATSNTLIHPSLSATRPYRLACFPSSQTTYTPCADCPRIVRRTALLICGFYVLHTAFVLAYHLYH